MNAPERPYLGLRYFEERDAHLFYGRDEHVAELLGRLAGNRFVAVLGASGSGKSSFVRAGLLPELRAGMIPKAGPRWKAVEFKPGRAPLGELGDALGKALNVENARELVEEGPLGIARAVQAAQLDKSTNVLIIADQFEEVFRFQKEDAARALEEGHALTRRLLDAAAQTDLPIYVLLVMRSDYLGECAQFPDLPERMSESLYLVPRLRRDQLEETITAPVGGRIEPAVVQRLLAEVGSDPDQLPLLQHLLGRMWDGAAGQPLTMAHYDAAGGWTQGLGQHLEDVFRTVPEDVCRKVFQQLSELDKGRAVRRRASPDELTAIAGPNAHSVIEAFRAEGFVLPQTNPVDLTHECILRDWSRIRGWLEDEQRDANRLHELAEAARDAGWPDQSKAQPIEGLQLQNLLAWRKDAQPTAAWAHRYGVDFAAADEYLTWSQQRDDERRAAREALQRQLQEETAARLRRTRWMLGLSGLFVALLAGLGWMFYTQKRVALARQLLSRSELVFGEAAANIERAVLLATSSLRLQPTFDGDRVIRGQLSLLPRAQSAAPYQGPVRVAALSPDCNWLVTGGDRGIARLIEAATGVEVSHFDHQGPISCVAISPDRRWVALGGDRGSARVMDAATGKEVSRIISQQTITTLAFSPDSRWVAIGSTDGTVRVMDVVKGREVSKLPHQGNIFEVAFSPNSKLLATASEDRTARVMEAATGKEVARLRHQGQVLAVAFSPDGSRVATGSGFAVGEVRVMEAATGSEVWHLDHQGGVGVVAFSPDGELVATGGNDRTARVIEAATGREVSRLTHHGAVVAVAFSRDGRYVVTGSSDKTARVMVAESGKEVSRRAYDGAVTAVTFSPDGKSVATLSADRASRVEAHAGQEVSRFFGHAAPTIAVSANGNFVALGPWDSTARIIDAATGQEIFNLTYSERVSTMAFSPDSRLLAVGGGNGSSKVLDRQTGEGASPLGHKGEVTAIAFSGDGKSLATVSHDKTVRVTEAATGKELSRFALPNVAATVAFSPDGERLATGGWDNTARLLETLTGREVSHLKHQHFVSTVVFSPNGRWVATGSLDKTARVMEVATGKEISRLTHQGAVRQVAFSPDDKWVATRGDDNTVRVMDAATGEELHRLQVDSARAIRFTSGVRALEIWQTDATDLVLTRHPLHPDDLIREACQKVTRNLTVAEWRQYVGKETPYQRSCDNLPYPPDYDKR